MGPFISRPMRIAIVGGGPAGSLFALYALHYADRIGRAVTVDVFEPRDFRQPGARGCNMCAGIIPAAVLGELQALGVEVPRRLILGEIDSYVVHTGAGSLRVTIRDLRAHVVAVYRGNGPGPGRPPEPISFDGFLLAEAERRGARVIRERVREVAVRPLRCVRTQRDVYVPDLIVLASGVNGGGVRIQGAPYGGPRTETMAQAEVWVGEEEVRRRLGSAIHVLLPRGLPVVWGTLVPKGAWVGVSLLGRGLGPRTMKEFLELEPVRRVLPEGSRQLCSCQPRIAVGPARFSWDEGFVAVGDAGVTRLYKNGVGTARVTAQKAAETAVLHGIGVGEFRRHYAPVCRRIHRDNWFGRVLFRVAGVLMRSHRFSAPSLVLADREEERPTAEQVQGRILWGLLTGSEPYQEIFRMLLGVGFQRRWLACLVRGMFLRPVPNRG